MHDIPLALKRSPCKNVLITNILLAKNMLQQSSCLSLVEMQIAFHNRVAADAANSNLAAQISINMEFLKHELANGYRRSKEMVVDQQSALTGIVSTHVDLHPLNSNPFEP